MCIRPSALPTKLHLHPIQSWCFCLRKKHLVVDLFVWDTLASNSQRPICRCFPRPGLKASDITGHLENISFLCPLIPRYLFLKFLEDSGMTCYRTSVSFDNVTSWRRIISSSVRHFNSGSSVGNTEVRSCWRKHAAGDGLWEFKDSFALYFLRVAQDNKLSASWCSCHAWVLSSWTLTWNCKT